MEAWMWLVLLYGVLKGLRDVVKKKALVRNSVIEVLFFYTLIGFIFVIFYIIHLSTVVTKQNKAIVKLVQEIAILNKKIEEKENEK